MNTDNDYKNPSERVSERNKRRDNSNGICLSCYAHPRLDDCQLAKRIKKHRLKFLDGERNCKICKPVQEQEYAEILNKGGIFTSLEHYKDLDDSVKLFNISQTAYCQHEDHHTLKKRFQEILQDLEAAIADKKYSVSLKNAYSAMEFLKSQNYWIESYGDIENEDLDELGSQTKSVVHLPNGRISTTEDESKAIVMLSDRPIITNMKEWFFIVLRNGEVEKT